MNKHTNLPTCTYIYLYTFLPTKMYLTYQMDEWIDRKMDRYGKRFIYPIVVGFMTRSWGTVEGRMRVINVF